MYIFLDAEKPCLFFLLLKDVVEMKSVKVSKCTNPSIYDVRNKKHYTVGRMGRHPSYICMKLSQFENLQLVWIPFWLLFLYVSYFYWSFRSF